MTINGNNVDIAVLKSEFGNLRKNMKEGFRVIVQDNKEQANDIRKTMSDHVDEFKKAIDTKADKVQTDKDIMATRQDYNKVLMMIISLFLAGIVSFIYQIFKP